VENEKELIRHLALFKSPSQTVQGSADQTIAMQ